MRTLITAAALAVCTATLAGPLSTAGAGVPLARADDLTTTTPIKHVVVVFQENASFDHYFGTYPIAANPPGEPPFVARPDTPAVNNLLPSPLNGNRDLLTTNPNQDKPFRLDRTQFATCSQDHGYKPEQRAANGGLMNRFVQATDKEGCAADLPRPVPAPQVMGHFDGNTVTALWNYAQHFALNDNSFATNYGPSTPGALNLVAGRTSGASPDNDKTVAGGVVYGDADPVFDTCSDPVTKDVAELSGPNIGDLLTGDGVPWGWFQGGFRLDPEKAPTDACEATTRNLAGIEETNYEAHHNPFQYFASTANREHLPPSSEAAIGHDDQANHLYDLDDFWAAADDGNLPAVSFLKAAGYQDGHPGPQNSNPLNEQDFLVETLNHLQRLPEWSSTAVILAWDDSDGEYDHQFPPNVHHSGSVTLDGLYGTTPATLCLAPAGKPAPKPETIFPMRCGYGERLPLLVVSPYARNNYVDHTLTDQTSILKFIEDNWGLGRLGQASFDSDPSTGSVLGMFDFTRQRADRLFLNHLTGNPNRPPSVELSDDSASVEYSDEVPPIEVTASDPDADGLTVDAVGLPEGLAISPQDDGTWKVAGTDQAPAGTYDVTIRVSDGTSTTERPLEIQVAPERAQVGYTGDLIFSTGSAGTTSTPVTLRAHVTPEEDGSPGDVTRAAVLFDLYGPGNATATPDATYPASPNAAGDASVDIASLGTGTWTVVVRTDRSAGYFEAQDSDVVPVTVYTPTTGRFVTGGGWVHDPGYLDRPVPISPDDHGEFGLDARLTKDGTPSGTVTYAFTGADGQRYVVRSTGWQGGGLAIAGNHATIAGTCAITVLDADGAVLSETAGGRFRLDVNDNGRSDTLALSVFAGDGTLYHRVGTPSAPLDLGGGQVVIHR
jgi:phospholipase C